MRSPRIALFALVLPLVACGWSVRSLRWHTPDDVTLTYEFETEHRLSTTFERLPGSPGEDEVVAAPAGGGGGVGRVGRGDGELYGEVVPWGGEGGGEGGGGDGGAE